MTTTPNFTPTERLLHKIRQAGIDRTVWVGDSFWAGDGDELLCRLNEEGWTIHRYTAPYYWVARRGPFEAPDTRFINYVEGDVYFHDDPCCGR